MASIEVRTSKAGATSYAIKWRDGGTRAGAGRTFTVHDPATAETLRGLIEVAGHRWPTDDQLRAFGLAQLVDDVPPVEPAAPLTVLDLVTRYIDSLAALGPDGPMARTLRTYRGYVARHLEHLPLGKMLAAEVEHHHIEDWQLQLRTAVSPGGRGVLSAGGVRQVRLAVLSPAFKWACSVRSGTRETGPLLTSNPCLDARAPRKPAPRQREILVNPAEYAVLIEEARRLDAEWAAMVELCAATGLRFSEVSGLRRDAIDVRRGVLHVVRRWTDGQLVDGSKNGAKRTVPVPADIMARIVVPRLDRAGGLLFSRPDGSRWAYSLDQDRWDALRPRLAARGVTQHITHHCLRTGYVTWLKGPVARIDPDKVSLVVGHKLTSMTGAHYTQLTESDMNAIRAAAATLVGVAA